SAGKMLRSSCKKPSVSMGATYFSRSMIAKFGGVGQPLRSFGTNPYTGGSPDHFHSGPCTAELLAQPEAAIFRQHFIYPIPPISHEPFDPPSSHSHTHKWNASSPEHWHQCEWCHTGG